MMVRTIASSLLDRFGTLPWAYFSLMGIGLVLASIFLWVGKLDGGEWVTLCSVLFSADRAASAISSRAGQ